MNDEDLYKILGVAPEAEDFVIRAAYKALAQRYHPDRWEGNPEKAHQKMSAINRAYEILGDLSKRKSYDEKWRSSQTKSHQTHQNPERASSKKPPERKAAHTQRDHSEMGKPPHSAEKSEQFNWKGVFVFAAVISAISLGKSWISESTYKGVSQQVDLAASQSPSGVPPQGPAHSADESQIAAQPSSIGQAIALKTDATNELIQDEAHRLAAGDVNSHYKAFWSAVDSGDRRRAQAFGPNLHARFEAGVTNAEQAGDSAAANSLKEFRDQVAEALGRLQSKN